MNARGHAIEGRRPQRGIGVFLPVVLCGVALSGCRGQRAEVRKTTDWEIRSTTVHSDSSGTFRFANGREYHTAFRLPELVGSGESASGTPYLLFKGVDCLDCDAGLSLYVVIPQDTGQWVVGRYPYSGTGDGWAHFKATAYFGACVLEPVDVVWRVSETGEGDANLYPGTEPKFDGTARMYRLKVYTTDMGAVLIREDSADAKYLMDAVSSGSCTEIPPIEHFAEVGFPDVSLE